MALINDLLFNLITDGSRGATETLARKRLSAGNMIGRHVDRSLYTWNLSNAVAVETLE